MDRFGGLFCRIRDYQLFEAAKPDTLRTVVMAAKIANGAARLRKGDAQKGKSYAHRLPSNPLRLKYRSSLSKTVLRSFFSAKWRFTLCRINCR
jgi:hypothetical protein